MFKPGFKKIHFQISAQTINTYILMHFLIKPVFSITEKQKNMAFYIISLVKYMHFANKNEQKTFLLNSLKICITRLCERGWGHTHYL